MNRLKEITDKINMDDYDYNLPEESIAQYPVKERDKSKLLVYNKGMITQDIFRNIDKYISSGSLLVFNNTRVIRARFLFRKETGALIEIFCIEPLFPADYELSFSSKQPVEWKCIIGNLKRWKNGPLKKTIQYHGKDVQLIAEKIQSEGEIRRIRFAWDCHDLSFSDITEMTGHVPLPPYIKRADNENDGISYQTVYSSIKGSVAAPTAGLHFTEKIIKKIREKGIETTELTLHIGAGTFKPVKTDYITKHDMHTEHFFVTGDTIEKLLSAREKVICVGTTSVRTLESLYWLGVKTIINRELSAGPLILSQWEAYEMVDEIPVSESLEALLNVMASQNLTNLLASTKIMIVPGYNFRMINGLITNFHLPRSTLLLLTAAWVGDRWKSIYRYGLLNNFRMLSYGDSSLLFR